MQGKDFVLTGLENILKAIPEDQAEIVYHFEDNQLTRFANNHIHQNVAEKDFNISIKAIRGKKISIVSINSFEPEIINSAIGRLTETLEYQPEDPEFVSLPFHEPITFMKTYDNETGECSPERRAEMVKVIIDKAEKFAVIASGHCNTKSKETAVVNSYGIRAYNTSTSASLLSLVYDKMEGFSSLASQKISDIDPYLVAEESVSKCVKSRHPVEVTPDYYTVILDSYGVGQLLEYLCLENFNAKDYIQSRSCVSGKMNQKITGDLINLLNDPYDPSGLPLPFDMEGLPVQKVVLIEKGIARGVVHNTYTANLMDARSTGNKVNPVMKTPHPLNISMPAGTSSLEKMIERTEKGIYVTRLNYINIVNQKQTIHTGLTRGGSFLIENGKITSAINNLRFTDSILGILNEVSMISEKRLLCGEIFSSVLAPALKINKFRFTGSTKNDMF